MTQQSETSGQSERPIQTVEIGEGSRMVAYQPGYAPEKKPKPSLTQRIRETVKRAAYQAGKYAGERAKTASRYTREKFKAGAKIGLQETKEKYGQAVYGAGRAIGAAPARIGQAAYGEIKERAELARQGFKERRGLNVGAGIKWQPGQRGIPANLQGRFFSRSMFGGIRSINIRTQVGRTARFPVDRGVIKTYWSKKLKKLARQMVRRYGADQGIARTRQVATIAGWKMQ